MKSRILGFLGASALAAAAAGPLSADTTLEREFSFDPARVRIVSMLARSSEPACVCELTPPLGLSQPTVSHHLKKLVQAGLLEREQRGVWAYYTLDRAALERAASVLDLKGVAV